MVKVIGMDRVTDSYEILYTEKAHGGTPQTWSIRRDLLIKAMDKIDNNTLSKEIPVHAQQTLIEIHANGGLTWVEHHANKLIEL